MKNKRIKISRNNISYKCQLEYDHEKANPADYDVVIPTGPNSTYSISVCRKCFKNLLKSGIRAYNNELKEVKSNGKEK